MKWTQEEDNILKNNYFNKTVKEIVKLNLLPGRTLDTIQSRAKKLRLLKGRGKFIRTTETKLKSSISAKNRVRTDEEIRKTTENLLQWSKTHPHSCLGKTWKIKLEKDNYRYRNKWRLGKKHTQASKDKISKTKKAQTNELTKENCRKAAVISCKKQSLFNPTKIEIKMMEFLKINNIDFIFQYEVSGRMLFDFYIPMCNLIIETDGDYWHSLEKVKKRDKSKEAYIRKLGYNLLRITETEINNHMFEQKTLNTIKGDK